MTSLVAAGYGTSSDDENSDEETRKQCDTIADSSDSSGESNSDDIDEDAERETELTNAKNVPLPSASALLATSTPGLVFNNPFKIAENAKIASLEKHVKMVESEEKTKTKNGKKICWNFRKGRCRFGSHCTYAHDSDLHRSGDGPEASAILTTTQIMHKTTVQKTAKVSQLNDKGKKRPGLSHNLTPSKKVMSHYHSTKSSK